MNRAIHFVEFQSPENWSLLRDLIAQQLTNINVPLQNINAEYWLAYSSDMRVDHWDKKIKPKSKIILVHRKAPQVNLEIAFENSNLIVIDKEPGLPTQKTLKAYEDNLFDQVRLYCIQKSLSPIKRPYVGLHHRLDRGTSGLVLMTKKRSANKEVSELFKNRKISKDYLAYTQWGDGSMPQKWLQKDPIQRGNAKKKKFFFEVNQDGDEAISQFEILEAVEGQRYLVKAKPLTGRTHQLRVHLSHKGYPILGDKVYGWPQKGMSRLMLHAQAMEFKFMNNSYSIQSQRNFSIVE